MSCVIIDDDILFLQAAQIMIGLIHSALGHIWTALYVGQSPAFAKIYRPFVLLSGYPFWSFVIVSELSILLMMLDELIYLTYFSVCFCSQAICWSYHLWKCITPVVEEFLLVSLKIFYNVMFIYETHTVCLKTRT